MFCSKCGQQNSDNGSFCIQCGQSLQKLPSAPEISGKPVPLFSEESTTRSQHASPSPRTDHKGKAGLIIALAISGLVLISALLILFLGVIPMLNKESGDRASDTTAAESAIVGLWTSKDAATVLKFKANGDVTIYTYQDNIKGTFEYDEKNEEGVISVESGDFKFVLSDDEINIEEAGIFTKVDDQNFDIQEFIDNNTHTTPTTIVQGTTSASFATTTTAAATTAESATTPYETTPPNVIAPAMVTDEDTTPIIIYAWNNEFQGLIDKYYVPDHAGFTYDYRITESTTYQTKLDSVLSSGDGAPDIFLVEADYADKYVNANTSLNINELGIDYSELANQFSYTYEFMTDDGGAIKALSWAVCPSGVFYNRTLATKYLGSDDPADVQKSFATWDAFMAMAEKINTDSAGKVKAISGYDDIYRTPNSNDYATQLMNEGLTFGTTLWSSDWSANMNNSSVLSYWGPMWLAQYCMYFSDESNPNPTTGDWAFCAAPEPSFWGGTWIVASKYDNQKATTADIMRYFTIDEESMYNMAQDGQFVNNIPVMTAVADDPAFEVNILGGQNPFDLMVQEAMDIVVVP